MFCRIYTSFRNWDAQSILSQLAMIVKGKLEHQQYVEKEGYSIEIRRNDEFDYFKARDFPDGFLFFPYSIELDIDDWIDLQAVINEVNNILKFLWENKCAGVASCDFEDQLINKGGYKSKEVPWI